MMAQGVPAVVVGFVAALVGTVLALLLVFFSRSSKKQKLPPVSPVLVNDFVAPSSEFAAYMASAGRVRLPGKNSNGLSFCVRLTSLAPLDADQVDALCDSLLRQQGVLPHTYSIEKESQVARLSGWLGCLTGMGGHNPALPAWHESSWAVVHVTLLSRALMIVFSEKGELLGLVHLERCQVEGYDPKVEELAGCGFVKLFNVHLPICSYNNATTMYLMFPSPLQQKNWLTNLTLAVVECDHAMDRAFSKMPPPAWLSKLDAERGGDQVKNIMRLTRHDFLTIFVSEFGVAKSFSGTVFCRHVSVANILLSDDENAV